jgi:hydroxyethylthiazole kinase-like uncharacterized protein yjeF
MPKSPRNKSDVVRVTRTLLRQWPIPAPSSDDDKDSRGRVLVVGGELSLPGAVVLAGIAALRAGAGKLQIATCKSIAPLVGIAVPEALSLGLDETANGTLLPQRGSELDELIQQTDALLIGPGTKGSEEENQFFLQILRTSPNPPVVIDAGALDILARHPAILRPFGGKAVITPHAKEMARILNVDAKEIEQRPKEIAIQAAQTLDAVVALKGSKTYIATNKGEVFCYDSGDVGLATSGSGDTLAGVVAGLLARQCTPLQATLWAVFLHGSAGNRLAKRVGRVGYLARELVDEIPQVMRSSK